MKVIKKGKNNDIEIAMQPEAVFKTEEERREITKTSIGVMNPNASATATSICQQYTPLPAPVT